jgi:hypothetical protein
MQGRLSLQCVDAQILDCTRWGSRWHEYDRETRAIRRGCDRPEVFQPVDAIFNPLTDVTPSLGLRSTPTELTSYRRRTDQRTMHSHLRAFWPTLHPSPYTKTEELGTARDMDSET